MSNQSQTSPIRENLAHEEEEDQNLQEPSQEPPRGGGGGGDERKVATLSPSAQKTSIARNIHSLKPHAAMSSAPQKEVAHAVLASLGLLSSDDHEEGATSPDEEEFISKRVSNLKPKSTLTAKNFEYSLRNPLGMPAKRLFENSANDGVSDQEEEEKKIKVKDKVGGEGGGGDHDQNPRDDSASI
jgi:hypothetical protein